MEAPLNFATLLELFLQITPEDGDTPEKAAALERFQQFMRKTSTQSDLRKLEQKYGASVQYKSLGRKYDEIRKKLDESELLEGDTLSWKQVIIHAIVTMDPYLNYNQPSCFINVLKACKKAVNGDTLYKEGTGIIHSANNSRHPCIANRIEGGKVVVIRTMQLQLLGLKEIELSQHTSEYGALMYETIITIINMLYNQKGCLNRNINATTGACKKRINIVKLLVLDFKQLKLLHEGNGDVQGIPNIRPVWNEDWDRTVNRWVREAAPWLPFVQQRAIYYENQDELQTRLNAQGIPYRRRGRWAAASTATTNATTATANAATTASPFTRTHRNRNANENASSFVSSDDEDDDENDNDTVSSDEHAIATRTFELEDGIRVRRGNERYSGLPTLETNLPSSFSSFTLSRSTISEASARQLRFDDCLKPIDVDLLSRGICMAESWDGVVEFIKDMLNRGEILLGIEPFRSSEFEPDGELYKPLIEVCLNVNHANVGDNELGATFFKNAWLAWEYKQKECPDVEHVIVKKASRTPRDNYERFLYNLDVWLNVIGGFTKQTAGGTSFGRTFRSDCIESTLLNVIGIIYNDYTKYVQLREAVRSESRRKRLIEEPTMTNTETEQRKKDGYVAAARLFAKRGMYYDASLE